MVGHLKTQNPNAINEQESPRHPLQSTANTLLQH